MNASDEAAVHHGQALEHFNRKEHTLAFDHFLAAAELGHIQAQFCVGKMYADGDFYRVSGEVGLKEDRTEAVRWYQRAADAGLPAAQKCLGLCFCQGNGVGKNLAMGRKWLVLAAKQRDRNALFEPYVARLLVPTNRFKFLHIFTPDGTRGFGLTAKDKVVEAGLTVEWRQEAQREAAIRAFFSSLGTAPSLERGCEMARSGSWIGIQSPNSLAELPPPAEQGLSVWDFLHDGS